MHSNDRKERFSLAYIGAVAARAGFDLVEPKVDRDSVDGALMSHAGRRPRIEFQAKATARDVLGETDISYALSIKNYDDLRADVIIPRLLIVVLLPDNEDAWLSHSEEELVLRHCGYWCSLAGEPETDSTTSVTVRIPRTQRFEPAALQSLMHNANLGHSL
ncbi:MAG: DUF4365 domain-containing protein [Thiohalocapsa sp.]